MKGYMLSKKFTVTKEDCERFNKANPGYELSVCDGENTLSKFFGPGDRKIARNIRSKMTEDGVVTELFPPWPTIGVPIQIASERAKDFVHGLAIAARALEGEPERDRPWWVPCDAMLQKFRSSHGRYYVLAWSGATIHVLLKDCSPVKLVGTVELCGRVVIARPPRCDEGGWVFKDVVSERVCFDAQAHVLEDINARDAWPKPEKKKRVWRVMVEETKNGDWSASADGYGTVVLFIACPTREMVFEALSKAGYDATQAYVRFFALTRNGGKCNWIPSGDCLDGFKRKVGDSWYLLERDGDGVDIVRRTETVVGRLLAPGVGHVTNSTPSDVLRQAVEYVASHDSDGWIPPDSYLWSFLNSRYALRRSGSRVLILNKAATCTAMSVVGEISRPWEGFVSYPTDDSVLRLAIEYVKLYRTVSCHTNDVPVTIGTDGRCRQTGDRCTNGRGITG